MKRSFVLVSSILFVLVSCQKKERKLFSKLESSQTSIDFANRLSDRPELNILNYLYYYNGSGIAAADFNKDGFVDLYFSGNQVPDELYLNQGNLTFKKVTKPSGIDNSKGWTTGVSHVDINGDGLLDIYICKVGNYRALEGRNLLYINKGINSDGIPIFEENAALYGLDFSGFSTHATFFDYDIDGDLDMYLMNHSVHPNRTYGRGALRKKIDSLSGDRLYQNDNGIFKDITQKAGIFQGKIGYGLGLSTGDVNNDGYPDIYVGNDFFENDYLYINQKDGTFSEVISSDNQKLGHTTHFSMGNAISDINNDGMMDILSVDMLPENLETYKTSGLEYGYPIYQQYLKNGYAPQFMQNTLHLNLGEGIFSEIGNLSGITATEWSWGALLADFDNDGFKDIFISNGIKGATNDMDYMNFIANEDIQRRIDAGMKQTDMPLINELPEKKVSNYFFKNNGDLTFSDTTEDWFEKIASFSNGCIYADLDNDGDLDLVVNNINEKAFILENTSGKGNYLQIEFKGKKGNSFGIGCKVIAYGDAQTVSQEHFTTNGYLSATPNLMHLGLGKDSIIDSLKVIWPNGAYEVKKMVKAKRRLSFAQKDAKGDYFKKLSNPKTPLFYRLDSLVDYTHKELTSLDFDREPLIPFANSNQGPHISIADINQDGLDDFFISGAKKQASALFVQNKNGEFKSFQEELFSKHIINEDITSVFFDADGDNDPDLIVASGGNEFKTGEPLQPRLYLSTDRGYELDTLQFRDIAINTSKLVPFDFDNDGDNDIIITSDQVTSQFGKTPRQYIFENNGHGNFQDITKKIAPELEYLGNIKDAVCHDIDGNGYKDLIVVGHWMPISVFLNDGEQLRLQHDNGLQKTNGWWNTIKIEDFDNDGDLDFVSGNWGTNSKFKASTQRPVTLYNHDFDDNQTVDPVVTHYHGNQETPFASKDELVKQMPFLNKRFLSYKSFAKASIESLFGKKKLKEAEKKQVYELRSCYFENDGTGRFKQKPLPIIAQSSVINDIAIDDFNNDGFKDLLIIGNNHEISTQLGRLDAFHGLILQNDKTGGFSWDNAQNPMISGACRVIKKITINGQESYIIGRNDDTPVFLIKN